MRPRSFDLIASNRETTLVIKVVSHIDSVSEEIAKDLTLVSHHLRGSPVIIGESARDAELERGAVYLRYGIYAISVATLHDFIVEGIPPLIYASPGGLYVTIDGRALRELRERRNMSLGDLGHLLGVSRRTISKYESGMGTTLDIALKIEEIFDNGLVQSIDLIRERTECGPCPGASGHRHAHELPRADRHEALHHASCAVPGPHHVPRPHHSHRLRDGPEGRQARCAHREHLAGHGNPRDVRDHRSLLFRNGSAKLLLSVKIASIIWKTVPN